MEEGYTRSGRLFLIGFHIILASLACNSPNLRPDNVIPELLEEADQEGITGELTRDQELDLYQNMEGERTVDSHHIFQDEISGCEPDYYFMGEQHSLQIDHIPGSDPAGDKITMRDDLGIREYSRYSPEQPFLYCRTYPVVHSAEETLPRLECIKITTAWRYELSIYFGNVRNDEFLCYSGVFEAQDDEEVGLVDVSQFENCLAKEGVDFNWIYFDPLYEEGSRATLCTFNLTVLNSSNEDLKLMFYESFDNRGSGGEGMHWDHWNNVQILPHGDEFIYDASHVKYDDGSETWAYGTMFLLMFDTPDCFPLTISDNEDNLLLWEKFAIKLENPCW